ncbi:hypothetical protein BLJAPNOD_02380 [Ensifer sp. M14]|uniref:phytanoyl-CoA dioxygenase family protein n=1 Tax=Ensifer sp. M14 TaxID=2203782 RepID=UPI000E2D05CE|nr:phytanoyl-CoA dioxygenase family protein [Ensifer sp. M14]RDL51248.1 hypothetical protein BLJAPNOD_02380 [Ensifer sp. M14]
MLNHPHRDKTTEVAFLDEYKEVGFCLVRGILDSEALRPVEERCLQILEQFSGQRFSGLDDPDLVKYLTGSREAEQFLYQEIRRHPELVDLSLNGNIASVLRALLEKQQVDLLEKIPFRIDCPMVLRELAVWHQDVHYVKGATETITAWIPLFDAGFKEGCLLVMPGTHKLGQIPHEVNVLGKKFYPAGIFDNPVKYVEMKRGDVLFFNSCLLHSSGNNISDTIRYSIQSRYLGADAVSDEVMGKRISVQ